MPDVIRHLAGVSRTFALCIPQLPAPIARPVGLAYLWKRVADTFEDAVGAPRPVRLAGLAAVSAWARAPAGPALRALQASAAALPGASASERALLDDLPALAAATAALPARPRQVLLDTVAEMADGMAAFVATAPPSAAAALRSQGDLARYCHVVAGIVGRMLTDLFVWGDPGLADAAPALHADALAFGEGLQLVNILKDRAGDAAEGRRFLPAQLALPAAFAWARADLHAADRYVATLREAGAHPGVVGFCAIPVALAWATLEAVEARGPGAKVSRAHVARILARAGADPAAV